MSVLDKKSTICWEMDLCKVSPQLFMEYFTAVNGSFWKKHLTTLCHVIMLECVRTCNLFCAI